MIALARLVKALKAIATDIKEGLLTEKESTFLFLYLLVSFLSVGTLVVSIMLITYEWVQIL